MAHPILTEKTTIEDMEIGDCIPCRYKAPVSGAVGEFSELGTCNAAEISKNGVVATPDGKFYFIKVDKGLLIADRVVQTNVSWQTLNNAGLIDGAFKKYGVVFNGSNSYATVSYVSTLAPTRVSIKVKISRDDWSVTTASTQTLVSKFQGGGYGIQINPNGNILFQVYANGAYRGASFMGTGLAPGEHTIYGTWDGRYARLYIDGELKTTSDSGGTYNISYARNNSLMFGADPGDTTGVDTTSPNYFNGKIHEIAIWDASINPLTLSDELTGSEANLVGWWKFEAFGGNKVYDKKGSNHATLYNHIWDAPNYRDISNPMNRMKFRSLSGGCIYADENGNPSFTDKLQGAFPTNNEWDTYIKKSTLDGKIEAGDNNIWNYNKCFSFTKGSPMLGQWVNRAGVLQSTVATASGRMGRGNDNRTDNEWKDLMNVDGTYLGVIIGFRPVLEFIELDSLQQNAYY